MKPFVVSLMADPSGAYTTAAAMVALRRGGAAAHASRRALHGQRVLVLGGTGPVGRIAGVLAAQAGAEVRLSSRNGIDVGRAGRAARPGTRFGVTLHGVSARRPRGGARRRSPRPTSCWPAPPPACRWCRPKTSASRKRLKVAADVNAVPPEGIAGVGVMDDAQAAGRHARRVGIGALAIGNVKYQTQHRLLVQMREAEKAVMLGFAEAFATARAFLAEAAGARPLRSSDARSPSRRSRRGCWPRPRRATASSVGRARPVRRPRHAARRARGCRSAPRRAAHRRRALARRAGARWRGAATCRAGSPAAASTAGPTCSSRARRCLPLLGTARGRRAPRARPGESSSAFWSAYGIAHPPVRHRRRAATRRLARQGRRRLRRLAHPCARSTRPRGARLAARYLQREVRGVADVGDLRRQRRATPCCSASTSRSCARVGERPFVFCGVIGPVPVSAARRSAKWRAPCARWRPTFALARPGQPRLPARRRARAGARSQPAAAGQPGAVPATSAVPACCAPTCAPACTASCRPRRGRARRVARQRDRLRAARAAARRGGRRALAARPGAHDLPRAGTRFAAGDPVCSVTASGADADAVKIGAGAAARRACCSSLETLR